MYESVPTGRPPSYATNGMVSTPHTLASSAGVDVLRRGGSAVDAAISANAVLSVAYPHMAGIGGDGFWMIGDGNDVRAINASGPAGSQATQSFYQDEDSIPERGPKSALTVPGAIDGWRLAHEEYGKLSWGELFDDAVAHARDGVPVTAGLSHWIGQDREILGANPQARETFLVDGAPPSPGERLHQPALADSLSTVASVGPRAGFYEGAIADRFCSGLAESPLEPQDFADYRAEWVEPLSVSYRDYTMHGMPPNTQGIAALQILGMLDGMDVSTWGDGTADYYHHLTEAIKLAFADRDAWVTDPTTLDIPADELLSESYLTARRELIAADEALPPSPEPGLTPPTGTNSDEQAGGDTCYLSVVDSDGLAVSMIQSVYFDFGSGVVAGDTGIIPQNRGSSFSLDPTDVNSLQSGKRPFHTLIPSMLTQDGEPRLVFGTMGGEGQPQTQAALVSRIVDFGYDVQRAIEAPRWLFGRTWGAESHSLSLEGRIPDGVIADLEARGQAVSVGRDYDAAMGHAQAIRLHPDGLLEGGADPRGDGAAIGY